MVEEGLRGLVSSVECIIGLDVMGREGIFGVNKSFMGDEYRGYRSDTKYFSDGGF